MKKRNSTLLNGEALFYHRQTSFLLLSNLGNITVSGDTVEILHLPAVYHGFQSLGITALENLSVCYSIKQYGRCQFCMALCMASNYFNSYLEIEFYISDCQLPPDTIMKTTECYLENEMRTRKEIIFETMDSMLASAQLEAKQGITLKNLLIELEFLREYPKEGESGKFTRGQVSYIKRVLDSRYRVREIENEKYYIGQGLLF
jgi:hypothetical protein